MSDNNFLFRLRPIKAAKVSEISESTASSSVPAAERVNFHIGNPVQDERLIEYFLKSALNYSKEIDFKDNWEDPIIEEFCWDSSDKPLLNFLNTLIRKSAPYTPRGGYMKSNPHELINIFQNWLLKEQQEALPYDIGEKSGRREIILSSGGITESLRVLIHALSNYMVSKPINIFLFNKELPKHIIEYNNINFITLPDDEKDAVSNLINYLEKNSDKPNFLMLGSIPSEEARRKLRELGITYPLFFIEVNNAFNHQSLAREAKMVERVIRFLTPVIFSEKYKLLSTVFIVGNANFLNVIETVHFQLKGTPSASEIELLAFLIKNKIGLNDSSDKKFIPVFTEDYDSNQFSDSAVRILSKAQKRIEKITAANNKKIAGNLDSYLSFVKEIHAPGLTARIREKSDLLTFKNCKEVFQDYCSQIDSRTFYNKLSDGFLFGFINNHKEYEAKYCLVVSGSSRTALGILGFHCGIDEVITTDLSWTYEHCFPRVSAIPLTDKFEIDTDAIKDKLSARISLDPEWRNHGAVVINNPNNATGRIFSETKIKDLIKWCVNNKIYLIDDLSYQNVTPDIGIEEIKTLAQLGSELTREGYITKEDKQFIITVHSLSKTDALAGARLSVVEISDKDLFDKFEKINQTMEINVAAIFLTYLFYRNERSTVSNYWKFRNYIFNERMQAIMEAKELLPVERNPYGIDILPAKGSMYPLLTIKNLPSGLSLDWISSGLARQGIGLVPLTTFAKTEKGYELARTTFRLTLGGVDDKDILHKKTRRVIIDLNRMVEEESLNYNKKLLKLNKNIFSYTQNIVDIELYWSIVEKRVKQEYSKIKESDKNSSEIKKLENEFSDYLFDRLRVFKQKIIDKSVLLSESLRLARSDKNKLKENLEYEFYKDNLSRRETTFKKRLYDRTVHPTQMYSLSVEIEANKIINHITNGTEVKTENIKKLVENIRSEFLGLNVAINSSDESDELLLDLDTLLDSESYVNTFSNDRFRSFLSFWGDWDGSNRPSGQGHRLVATVLIENVKRLSSFIKVLIQHHNSFNIPSELRNEIENLKSRNENFIKILNDITNLTHQLEKRFKGILPYNIKSGKLREVAVKYHLSKDPVKSKWEHNDRLEHKMIDLRNERRRMFEVYFALNKMMRKTLYDNIQNICNNLDSDEIAIHAAQYKDLLKRTVITPRIHQKLITTQDQFAIDTTVHNINEINEISGKYGNPGMILSLQISMSTEPDAVILLDRKMRAKKEEILRRDQKTIIPDIWLIPLFEDKESTLNVESYLNKLWDYAFQSRKLNQDTADRFSKIICELFIAGSDLSQFIGQPPAMALFKEAKYKIINWITEKSLLGNIRVKLGSGEPMQRQGGYYAPNSGKRAFIKSKDNRLNKLKASARKSAEYASTPLLGIFAGGDLRTLQSNISEKMRALPVRELSELLYHLRESQKFYENELQRAGEPLTDTRLQFKTRGLQELERLTIGKRDTIFEEFLNIFTDNFRHILYGKDEDVIGIHIISYFIARATPPLRDRPTIRPDKGSMGNRGQKILERISEMIPLSKYGSLLRAIAHNQSQTMILGINQLTTGLFRTLDVFAQKHHAEGENQSLISDRILPYLPVYEILHSLRIYQDTELNYIGKMEQAFPAGNSAFHVLREDSDVMSKYIPVFQRELLRRHGLAVPEFFESSGFIPDLLPTLRSDIAILLQQNIFNTNPDDFLSLIKGKVDKEWMDEISELLIIPQKIKLWRERIWNILEKPVSQRISSFSELAIALNSISSKLKQKDIFFNENRLPAAIKKSITTDDTMHQFLTAAIEYLSAFSETTELPVNIIKALSENKIIKIEEQPITADQQKLLRFYTLQIARLAQENG